MALLTFLMTRQRYTNVQCKNKLIKFAAKLIDLLFIIKVSTFHRAKIHVMQHYIDGANKINVLINATTLRFFSKETFSLCLLLIL